MLVIGYLKGQVANSKASYKLFLEVGRNEKMSQLPTAVESLKEEGEDVEAVVQQSERYHLRQRIYNMLTL